LLLVIVGVQVTEAHCWYRHTSDLGWSCGTYVQMLSYWGKSCMRM